MGRGGRGRSGGRVGVRSRRWWAVAVVAALLPGLVACTPRYMYATVVNKTEWVLVPDGRLFDGAEIPPGERGRVVWVSPRCLPQASLVTSDRRGAVTVELCDRGEVTVTGEMVEVVSAAAAVRNASSVDLEVSVWSLNREDFAFRAVPVPAGGTLDVTLPGTPGACSEGLVYAEVVDGSRLRPQSWEDHVIDGHRTVVFPGAMCDGDIWTIDEAMVKTGSAVLTVVNRTGLTLTLSTVSTRWQSWLEVPPGERGDLPLGEPAGECVPAPIDVIALDATGESQAYFQLSDGVCPGVWEVEPTDLVDRDG